MSVYQPGDFVWSCYEGEWFEAEIEEVEPEGTYRVYYHEYDDSVPGQPIHLIKDYEEGETEPPPDGPNQENAPEEEYAEEEDYVEEEEYVEEYVEEEVQAEESNEEPETNEEVKQVVEDDGAARLAIKRAAMEKAARDKKAADAKAKADARAPTKPVVSKQFEAAKQAERRKSQKREELEKEFSFAPQLATRRGSGSQSRSSNRTSALYEHGKSKGRTGASFSNEPEPSPKTTAKKKTGGEGRTNRLYEAGKAREMARLQKEDAEKEIQARSSSSSSYDARMGFDKTKTGLGQDLVTTGARTNALYQEAQMREQKKKQLKAQKEQQEQEATFKPKLFTKNKTKSSSNVSSRLYNDGLAKNKKLDRKREEEAWSSEMTFQPDISSSQRFCESSSLPGARHEALFMQGEIQRMRREEMFDNFVDGKEVDDLTFTPAVNYRYNDELLGADTSDFSERLYKTDFTGSLAKEEENAEYYEDEECTFSPQLSARRSVDDEDESRESRTEKLYRDATAIQKKKQEKQDEIATKQAERKLQLTARQNMEEDEGAPKAHERLYSSHKKSLENKEKRASEPVKASFRPKFFSSKKSREEGSKRATEDLYKAGVDKVAAKRLAEKEKKPHHIAAAEEEAAKHSFKPQLATKKKKASSSSRLSVGDLEGLENEEDGPMNPMMRGDSMDSVSSGMSDLSVTSSSSRLSRKGSASSTGNLKRDKEAALRSERSSALQSKAAELLAKRQAAKAAQS